MTVRLRVNTKELEAEIRSLKLRVETVVTRVTRLVETHRWLLYSALGTAISCAAVIAWFLYGVVSGIPDPTALRAIGTMMPQATVLFDNSDSPAFVIFKEQRIRVPLKRISPKVVRALIAFEDQRFYDHSGLDYVRLAGAALNNLQEGRRAQGGSTITQQLARQSFLSPVKSVRRKVSEVVIAAWLEKLYTKDEILEHYLNKVYFGDGLYGIEAASLGYFGKHAADVDDAEAALLVGLLKSPSTYSPTVNVDLALSRRNIVLRAMRDARAIDGATYEEAVGSPVQLADALRRREVYGRYFKEEVRLALVRLFGSDRVNQGGLKVYTTIDLSMQQAAEAEVARSLVDIEKRQARNHTNVPERGEPLQAALVALDPRSGEIRAMVGGRDFNQSHFNRATEARRQPGSAFKPFVYAAALEAGFSPAMLISNLDDPTITPEGAWIPEDEHLLSPTMTMRTALRTSSNRAAVQMLSDVGISATVRYAAQLGMGLVPSVPSLALGSGEVTLMSITSAYGAFANQGVLPEAVLIRRVETAEGEVLFTSSPPTHRVLRDTTAFQMTAMLADVVNSGTAWPARRVGFLRPAAGKTGTTNDYRDAWFIGYTPRLVAGVWVGYDQPQTIVDSGYAGEIAVPLWGRFMIAATRKDKPEWFPTPSGVTSATICRLSGQLATESCRDVRTVDAEGKEVPGSPVYSEYFVRGTEPVDFCPLHGGGLIARDEDSEVNDLGPKSEPVVSKRGFWGRIFSGRDNARDPRP